MDKPPTVTVLGDGDVEIVYAPTRTILVLNEREARDLAKSIISALKAWYE